MDEKKPMPMMPLELIPGGKEIDDAMHDRKPNAGNYTVNAQSAIINSLRQKLAQLTDKYILLQRSLERVSGVLEGIVYQYGEKDSYIRIKKKHMIRVNVGYIINVGIEPVTKDLIVTLTPSPNVKRGEVKAVNPKEAFTCQSMTTNAKDAEKSSKCATPASTTTQKPVQDAEVVETKSSQPPSD